MNSDPRNPVIGVRSFGADPALVARHTRRRTSTGLQSAGVGACAKHFPGHGDTAVDSHLGLPTVDVGLDVLLARELVPFAAAVRAGDARGDDLARAAPGARRGPAGHPLARRAGTAAG